MPQTSDEPGNVLEMSEGATAPWGRIAEDGTVYRRTKTGEHPIGSWHAGSAAAGLAYYQRKYDDLATEIQLLERRLTAPTADVAAVRATAVRMREGLPAAAVIGDLDALEARLAELLTRADARAAERTVARAAHTARALAAKEALVAEAERLASSTDWKPAGDRLRAIVEEWRSQRAPTHGAQRRTESALWKRLLSAREEFGRRRGEHFAALDAEREAARQRKEGLVAEAERLVDSTEWGPTAARLKDLMGRWKAAGRAPKAVDDALWARFRAAQDTFFAARAAAFSERDAGYRANQERKEQLLAEAEAIDPAADLAGARRRLRTLQERWETVGQVPREAMQPLERRLAAVEERVRGAADDRRRPTVEASPLVIRLRESVGKLAARAERARDAGDERAAAAAEEALATQREWLAQAERAGS